MATTVGTIGVVICRFTTLVTFGNNIFRDPLPQPVIKNKVFTNELAFQSKFLCLSCIVDNPSFQVKYIFETIVQHKSGCFFATNAAGAIHDDVLVLVLLH